MGEKKQGQTPHLSIRPKTHHTEIHIIIYFKRKLAIFREEAADVYYNF